jgi:hypothetical protein
MAAASSRERVRTVALGLLGLVFFATAIVPVVDSILHAPRCTAGPMLNARYDGLVLGVIPNTVTPPTVPRLAWQFDTVRYRIRSIPTDSILCAVETPD